MRCSRPAASSRSIWVLLLLALSAIAAAAAYAATEERASSWRDRDIKIDGADGDWEGHELAVHKQHFSLGIVNDGEFLYICVPTKDVGTKAQLTTAGLVVWLDPVGGKKRRFGLHFPVPNPPTPPGLRRPPRASNEREPEPADGEGRPIPGQDSIGVLGPGKNDAKLVPITQAGGIDARIAEHGDLLVLELKVPLMRTSEHPYAPNIEPGQTVRMELEPAPFRGGMTPVGPYPRGVGIVIPIGGRPSRYPVYTEPFDVTMNVRLAKGAQ